MPRRMSRRREQRHAGHELLVAVDQPAARCGGPVHGPSVAEVARRPGLALGARQHNRCVGKVVDPADMIDVAVRDHELRDMGWREAETSQLRGRTAYWPDPHETAEAVQTVGTPGGVGVVVVGVREAGVHEDYVRCGADRVAEDRDRAAVLGDLERPVVEDRKPVSMGEHPSIFTIAPALRPRPRTRTASGIVAHADLHSQLRVLRD